MTDRIDVPMDAAIAQEGFVFPIQLSERVVRVGKIDFLVVGHYCGWEGIERRLGALMLEDIFGLVEDDDPDS